MEHYYITYSDNASQSGNYPHDITLGVLDNESIAEKYILEYFNSNYQEYLASGLLYCDGNIPIEVTPILITDDASLYLLYKGVFTSYDFELFCRVYNDYSKLQYYEKYKVDRGKGIRDAFTNFEKLINGEGKKAYQYTKCENWTDDDGNTYRVEVDSGWKIIDNNYVNQDIKKRYSL